MKTQHTPGAWVVYPLDDKFLIQSPNGIPGSPYAHLARVNQMSNQVGEANARLIAAAPDLLYALDYIRSAVGNRFTTDEKDMVNKAIAKATGEKEEVV